MTNGLELKCKEKFFYTLEKKNEQIIITYFYLSSPYFHLKINNG